MRRGSSGIRSSLEKGSKVPYSVVDAEQLSSKDMENQDLWTLLNSRYNVRDVQGRPIIHFTLLDFRTGFAFRSMQFLQTEHGASCAHLRDASYTCLRILD